jgi:hypothetical protein
MDLRTSSYYTQNPYIPKGLQKSDRRSQIADRRSQIGDWRLETGDWRLEIFQARLLQNLWALD